MYHFNFYMPTKVLFGPGKLNDLHAEVLPGKKALIITSNGNSTKKYGYLDRVQKELDQAGVEYALFDEIRPNPTNTNVMDGVKAVKDNGCDFVIALGGGSVMDCSKCIALMATNPGDIWDYSLSAGGGKQTAEYDAIPIVCITTSAGYYMMCTSAHTMEHVMGSFHDDLVHGAGLIEIAHAYYGFFADRKAAEEPMKKMAKAMGVENPASGQDFIDALDQLIADVGCADLKMSDEGITKEELKAYPQKVHEVLGGDITADPLPLSDEDYLTIFENAYR